jgi:beta-lactam-binding protein with PASTA domain
VSVIKRVLSALKRIGIVCGIAIAFTFGLLGAIYLSLRSSETRVPDIVGKDRTSAENTISSAGLNFRVRATRPTSEAKPDTVLIQLPHAGEVVKVGQTVAVDISRPGAETLSSQPSTNNNSDSSNKQGNANTTEAVANTSDNKEKKKPANRNANDNLSANANANRQANRNRNANTVPILNGNSNQATPVRANSNVNNATPRENVNHGTTNGNTNRRPPMTTPTP